MSFLEYKIIINNNYKKKKINKNLAEVGAENDEQNECFNKTWLPRKWGIEINEIWQWWWLLVENSGTKQKIIKTLNIINVILYCNFFTITTIHLEDYLYCRLNSLIDFYLRYSS